MRYISRSKALLQLKQIRGKFRSQIEAQYEPSAKSCATCETKGACCVDAHFVNVRVSRLEAAAMHEVLVDLDPEYRDLVFRRVEAATVVDGKFACPLFEPAIGCLVHYTAKPLACIAHACYERKEDLPPDELLSEKEALVEDLNARTYGSSEPWLPIPIALKTLLDGKFERH